MKLRKLLKDIPVDAVKGSKEVEITGICANSKTVSPGNLFIAKRGLTTSGAQYIADAAAAGAVAVLTDIYDPFLNDVVQIIHPDVASIESLIASEYYRHPSKEMAVIGITGTNGKTTTAYLVKHLMDGAGKPCGLIGTIEWIVGKNVLPSTHTTPDATTNQKLLHEMAAGGCREAVMEVSSHALDQGRVRGIDFDIALLTNLTREHLDYHKTMEDYAAAKALLFSSLDVSKCAIINVDSDWAKKLIQDCRAKVLSYGIENNADVRATEISFSAEGTRFRVHFKGEWFVFSTKLIGRFNVYNCLGAIAVGIAQNIPVPQIVSLLGSFSAVPGRLEKVPNSRGLNIFVDYAHTDAGLQNVLETLMEIKKGRLITVFGCGGNRDQSKRPQMARASERLSDFTIVTTDNPRNEDPESIIKHIVSGFQGPKNYSVEVDRQAAIEKAIKMASSDDIVLIAGKGHETTQIFAHQTIPFDDRAVASDICERGLAR